MRAYRAIFRIRFINSLQYRIAALAGLSTQFAWGFMEIIAFSAFYRSAPEAFPMTFSQTASYIWLQQSLVLMFFPTFNDEIITTITDGGIAYELVRPIDIYNRWFCQIMAARISGVSLRCLPIIAVAILLPYPYGLQPPESILHMAVFFLSLLLSFGVVISFSLLVYVSLFYTMSVQGTRVIALNLVVFMSGGIIPIPFFPEPFRMAAELLPFGSMQNMPLRIYNGDILGMDMLQGITLQIFWLVVLILLGRTAMQFAAKRVVVQGG